MQALFSVKESIPCLDAYKKERQRFLPQTCDERAENKAKKECRILEKGKRFRSRFECRQNSDFVISLL